MAREKPSRTTSLVRAISSVIALTLLIVIVVSLLVPSWGQQSKEHLPKSGPVVYPAKHPAREWNGQPASSPESLFEGSCPEEHARSKGVLRSSFEDIADNKDIVSSSQNGFVYGVFEAYASHHHLIIRPEDVWFAILTQLSFHINAHAEELRTMFVAHKGKEKVNVTVPGSMQTVDFGQLAILMTHEMDKFIIDADLRTWIMPNFTTTTEVDLGTAAVLMMGSMQKYFEYEFFLTCGIPSVTLLGTRSDWTNIRHRLDKLSSLGKEPTRFMRLLIPVLDYFILTFDDPSTDQVTSFWNRICHHNALMSGPPTLSGWITAFCFWDANGKRLYKNMDVKLPAHNASADFDSSIFHWVNTPDIPAGVVSVPVLVNDNGREYKTRMVAGSVGMHWTSSGQGLDESDGHDDTGEIVFENDKMVQATFKPQQGKRRGLDTLQPISGWWMYELKDGQT